MLGRFLAPLGIGPLLVFLGIWIAGTGVNRSDRVNRTVQMLLGAAFGLVGAILTAQTLADAFGG